MIGFFTAPYPDELLYSSCARYSDRVKYANKKSSIKELLGRPGLSAAIDFPSHINYLISILPPGSNYSAERIINENTLLPFYNPFLPSNRAKLIRCEMKRGSKNNNLRSRTATIINQIKKPNYLRFCPSCVVTDRNKYGETYWHRLHQLSGVLVCPIHCCFLENSFVEWKRGIGNNFFLAEANLSLKEARYLSHTDANHQQLLNLAENAQWLLLQKKLKIDNSVIRDRYYNQLLRSGLGYYNGRVKNNELYKAFQSFYSSSLLELLGCSIESTHRSWIFRILEKCKNSILHHPIRHLLMMNFLGFSAKEFFTNFSEFKPFVDGPYPCLNRAMDHYKELRIQKCEIFDNLTKGKKRGKPIGIFSCDCKFIYQRVGPDKSEEDRFRYDSIREYGANWENKLREMWEDLSLSKAEIARRLQVSDLAVTNVAYRLKFPMNKPGTRVSNDKAHRKPPRKTLTESKNIYRKKLLKIIRQNPNLSRKKLIKMANFEYIWLMRNDAEWMNEQLPKVLKIPRKAEHLDWIKIDNELSIKVKMACQEIYSINPPKRVSITEVIRRVDHKNWLEKREKKLLATAKILVENLETLEEYMLRKLRWCEEQFLREGDIPSYSQLISRAVIKNQTTADSEKIQTEIQNSLNRINRKLKQ